MQNIIKIVTILFLGCLIWGCGNSSNDLDVTVKDSDDEYKFSASFDEDKTRAVQHFINRSIQPNGIFASAEDRFDIDTELQDHTKFKLKSSPGELIIKISKHENSPASLDRIKKMCEGIKAILTEN